MDPKIFRKWDVHGLAEGENANVTPLVAHKLGAAFGTYLQRYNQKDEVVVGRDNRRSSYTLSRALIEGLRASGCKVIDLDLVATPVVYWQAIQRGDIGGVMVTGSHLPPQYNGFKLCVGNRRLFGSQIKAMRSFIQSKDLTYGDGTVTTDHSSYSRYVADLAARIPTGRPLKVVLDAGNGTAGLFAPRLLERWGYVVADCLYCEPDGGYANRNADLTVESNLDILGERVRETGADVGFIYDGDADRLHVVDETGASVSTDRLLALLARDLLSRHPGSLVIADVMSSQVVFDEVKRCGGKVEMCPTGQVFVHARMLETGALLAGEMHGHIFAGEDYYGCDDAFMVTGRVLQMLAAADQPLSALNASMPFYYQTPEYRIACPDADKFDIIDSVCQALASEGGVITVDGVRVQFEHGWGLLRPSNTEPVLALRFEAETEADARHYRELFSAALEAFPQVEPLNA